MNQRLLNIADKFAVVLSGLCAIHCLALPVLLIAMPTITSFGIFSDELFHIWLLYFVIPISSFALISGFLHFKNWKVAFCLMIGMVLLIAAVLVGHDLLGEFGEVGLTLAGSILIATGHITNLRIRNKLLVCDQRKSDAAI